MALLLAITKNVMIPDCCQRRTIALALHDDATAKRRR